ncbi:MAG TPA: hypothetical protein VGF28_19190 [Thermoanaerobaculia bacterium]
MYIITSQSAAGVADWVQVIGPDEITEGYAYGRPAAAPELRTGFRPVRIWWD